MVWSRLRLPPPLPTEECLFPFAPDPAYICAKCSVVLWDWIGENLTPLTAMDAIAVDWAVRDRMAQISIWSNPLKAERKLHWMYFLEKDADRVLDFLTCPH
jgi:hypothetical protein